MELIFFIVANVLLHLELAPSTGPVGYGWTVLAQHSGIFSLLLWPAPSPPVNKLQVGRRMDMPGTAAPHWPKGCDVILAVKAVRKEVGGMFMVMVFVFLTSQEVADCLSADGK